MAKINPTQFGFHWSWNVNQNVDGKEVPLKEFGRIYYVVNDFGDLILLYENSAAMLFFVIGI